MEEMGEVLAVPSSSKTLHMVVVELDDTALLEQVHSLEDVTTLLVVDLVVC